MKDGLTRKITGLLRGRGRAHAFAKEHRASLTVLDGPASGMEFVLGGERLLLGRGPGVDIAIDDDAISRHHASLELEADGWHVQDLGSTNGVRVNGAEMGASPLKHGDKLELGAVTLQYVVEDRELEAPRHELAAG